MYKGVTENFFSALLASVWSKNKGPLLDPPLRSVFESFLPLHTKTLKRWKYHSIP